MNFSQRVPCAQTEVAQPPFHKWVMPDGSVSLQFFRQGDDYLLRFPGIADFEVSGDGQQVDAWPAPGAASNAVQQVYLNQVLPLALSRQGQLVLHASTVELAGQAVSFIGPSGHGKSTLAASFATSGHRFLTDDGLLVRWKDDRPMAVPSHPSIRLWRDSQSALVTPASAVAPQLGYTSKTRILAGTEIVFCPHDRPLAAIYFLGAGDAANPVILPALPSDALMGLVRNSFLLDIEEQQMIALHFHEIARIANLPIHFHLDYPRRYEDLRFVRESIIQHMARTLEK